MNNTFWKYTFVYACGFLLLRGISFFLLPIYTNLLSTEDAGIVFLVYTVLAFLNPLYAYGMNASLFKYYHNNECEKNAVISTSFISLCFSSFVLSCFLYFFSDFFNILIVGGLEFQSYNWFLLIALILFFDSFSSRAFVVIRLLEQPVQFLMVGLINIILSLLCNYYFIGVLELASYGAILSIVIVSVFQAFFLSLKIFKYIKWSTFNFSLFKKMASFALPFLPSAILFVIIGFSDRWFIKYYLTLHDVGIYGAGYKLGSIMSLVVTGFSLNWQPYFLKKNHNDDNEFGKIGNLVIICLIVIFTLLSINAANIVKLSWGQHHLIGEQFWGCIVIIPWVALGYFFYGVYVLQMPSIFIKNKQNWSVFFWVLGACCNILGNFVLIPKIGILGAAISTAISYFIMMLAIIIKNKKWLPIKYSLPHVFLQLIISSGIILLFNDIPSVLFRIFCVCLYLLCSFLILKSVYAVNYLANSD